jgi:hypothetical protein
VSIVDDLENDKIGVAHRQLTDASLIRPIAGPGGLPLRGAPPRQIQKTQGKYELNRFKSKT